MAQASNFEMTFRQVRELVKTGAKGEELLGAVDKLLGAVLLLSPVMLGPTALPALGLIGAKNEIIKLAGGAVKKIAESSKASFVDRGRHIVAAHCLLTYTAFFEALQDSLPDFVKAIDLSGPEQRRISERAAAKIGALAAAPAKPLESDGIDLSQVPVPLPHPVLTRQQEGENRKNLYENMARQLTKFVCGLAVWERLGEPQRDEISTRLRDLPAKAVEVYELQYLAFAAEVPEYFIWSELREHGRTQQLTVSVREKLDRIDSATRSLDLGLANLANAISVIAHARVMENPALEVSDALNRTYAGWIAEPVIDDRYDRRDDAPALQYPRKRDIFVPQAYKVLRHMDTRKPLEDERMWAGIDSKDDLGAFVVTYLQSVYSTESPLVILGQPGSGKSLFTELLAATLRPPIFNAVRVKLRDIDAESELQTQIEQQIRKDTGLDVHWPTYAKAFPDSPPVIILDGYDELLQSSGKVYSGYLDKVHQFQRREANQKRPVRVIITSRVTLIDKAVMPPGVTVLRLQEFDEPRQQAWISVWNQHNQVYFSRTNTRPFHPGTEEKVLQLARQPLLMLMLAVYDSKENSLHHGERLDQTRLYHSLLCRFMERERLKDEEGTLFRALGPREQSEQIERDLERLGVAAVGMFNRQSLHITKEQLNRDIAYFDVERTVQTSAGGAQLSQAELLLGSFFFIHESRTTASGGAGAESESNSTAFEFLHNTFGEFLTADFILRTLLREAKTVEKLSGDDDLRSALQQRLHVITDNWFACLCYSALHSRPVILEMLREWAGHRLRDESRGIGRFLDNLNLLLREQIRSILRGTPPKFLVDVDDKRPFVHLSALGHTAIYSLNLIVLRTVLSVEGYVFDESLFSVPDSGCRPWDRLVYLWRSWYSLEALSGVSTILEAKRVDDEICLAGRDIFQAPVRNTRLDDVFNVAEALADDITAGLAGIYVYDSSFGKQVDLDKIGSRLLREGIDLSVEVVSRNAVDPRHGRGERKGDPRVDSIWGWNSPRYRRDDISSRALSKAFDLIYRPDAVTMGNAMDSMIGPSDLDSLRKLPSDDANKVVAIKSRIEPRWINDLLVKVANEDLGWIASCDAAGPILRATRIYPFTRGATLVRKALLAKISSGWVAEPQTSELAVSMAICGLALDVGELFRAGIKALSDRVLAGDWKVAELSLATLMSLLEMLIDGDSSHRMQAAFLFDELASLLSDAESSYRPSNVLSLVIRLALCAAPDGPIVGSMMEILRRPGAAYNTLLEDPLDVIFLLRLCRIYEDSGHVQKIFSRIFSVPVGVDYVRAPSFGRLSGRARVAISEQTVDDLMWVIKKVSG
ncbi:hypothetical protein SK854_36795 [Lentzea sp. BCCO 10_0061]|uniref:AAA+ ATPase domain-containing protein n=1 Tax=Lentzea sokolovensis TaxID=3095429 RepID=A0ABU4V7E6_9PSEU|nr:AAA family ATPase [Lentzea sp. BCCO 10_0061]MDX8147717.1 hypothetical protein [Lentzea sp. BCCO 10_0061]